MLTTAQIKIIRKTFQRLARQADAFAENFYNNLFSTQPTLRLLFPDELDAQKKKLVQMLALLIELLDDPDKFIPVLEESGRRHALYGVRDEHYETLRRAFLITLAEILGEDFTPETKTAWARLYDAASDTMKRGALELSQAPDKFAV